MALAPLGRIAEQILPAYCRLGHLSRVNLADEQIDRGLPWAVPMKGKLPNTLRRGLVLQDGKRLRQAAFHKDLAGTRGTYWIEGEGVALYVRPLDEVDPNHAQFEATTRGFIFAPEKFGLGYIHVKGFTIQHSGNCFPRPQQGALSTRLPERACCYS